MKPRFVVRQAGCYRAVAESDGWSILYRNRVRLISDEAHPHVEWMGQLDPGDLLEADGDNPRLHVERIED